VGKDKMADTIAKQFATLVVWVGSFACIPVLAQDVPYKPDAEFELKISMTFKNRPPADVTKVQVEETFGEYQKRTNTTPLPYLVLYLTVLKAGEGETKLSVSKGGKVFLTRKVEPGKVIKLDLGFADDIKDRTSEYEYIVNFLSDNKKPISRMVIYFAEDGDYLVNGTKRGKI
jgi:hypothetical protein